MLKLAQRPVRITKRKERKEGVAALIPERVSGGLWCTIQGEEEEPPLGLLNHIKEADPGCYSSLKDGRGK